MARNRLDAPRLRLLARIARDRRAFAAQVADKGTCKGKSDVEWYKEGTTLAQARGLCSGCWVREACFRLAVLDDTMDLLANGGSIRKVIGVRGGYTARRRVPRVKALLKKLRPPKKARAAA
ncbi:hypothetical protein [Nonomuraea antimicrobica]|uniref:hypothetical protein n=1 Tax=Nonomuraea antimicrobica TaxID=561173 RepID=UPI0031EF8C0B